MAGLKGVVAPRRYIVISSNPEYAQWLFNALMQTGENIAGYACGLPNQAQQLEQNLQPDVIVTEKGTSISSNLPVLYFDKSVNVEELARQILSPPTTPASKSEPAPAPCLTWRVALGFAGMAGGVGTTSLVCAFALAAARRGENTLLVDMAGGDCLPTLGGDLRRETAAWSVRKKEFGDGLTVIVADSLNHIERQPDALLIDLGAMTHRARIDAVTRAGVKVFYVLPHALDMAGVSHPAQERRLVTLAPKASASTFPFDPELVRRINAKTFEPADTPFMQACDAWMATQLLN